MPKILIVEDDIDLLNLYNETFSTAGFEVDLAEDGLEALQKLALFKPEIVLLDLMLPNIDGFTVLENIKTNPETTSIKVVVQTNLASEIQKEKALQLGADKFLIKTGNSPGNLVEEVNQVLEK